MSLIACLDPSDVALGFVVAGCTAWCAGMAAICTHNVRAFLGR
jgi:hypothetical protein